MKRLLTVSSVALAIGVASANEPYAGTTGAASSNLVQELPARDAIRELAREAGVVLIFDSRRITEDRRVLIDPGTHPRLALETVLNDLELTLQPVGASTFAVTPKIAPDEPVELASAEPAMIDPGLTDTILVTGTAMSYAPLGHDESLVKLDQDMIRLLTEARVSDAIFDLPQSIASITSANTALFGATAGLNLADLRGLGPERTAVLVNGRRRTATSGGNGTLLAVDLTSMPHAFLKQIEVLDFSQAAGIGPDAIGGSINLVVDKHTDGLEAGVRHGVSEEGDADQTRVSLAYGTAFANDRGSFFVGIEGAVEEGILGRDRQLSANPYGFAKDGRGSDDEDAEFLPGFGGSPTTPSGNVATFVTPEGERYFAAFFLDERVINEEGELEPFLYTVDQLYNWSAQQNRILPNERVVGFASADYQVSPQTDVFAEFQAGTGLTEVQLSPVPATAVFGTDPRSGDGVAVPLDADYVPQALRDAGALIGADRVVLNQRLVALGPRRTKIDRSFIEAVSGFEHRISKKTSVTGFVRHGRTLVEARQRGQADREALERAVDPEACAAAQGCALVNPFDLSTYTAAAPQIAGSVEAIELQVRETELALDLATEFDVGAAGPLAVLVGASTRHSTIASDLPDMSNLIGAVPVSSANGSLDQTDIFARAVLPLTDFGDAPGRIRTGFGARGILHSRGGWGSAGEVFVDWSPVQGLGFRGVASYGERFANLTEAFTQPSPLLRTTADPCSGLTDASSAVVVEQCRTEGAFSVPEGFRSSGRLARVGFVGNPTRDPERAKSYRADVTFEPEKLTPLGGLTSRFRVSYTATRIEDAIEIADAPVVDCYTSSGFSDISCGTNPYTGLPLIERDPETGDIVAIGNLIRGGGLETWHGIDGEVRLSYEPLNVPQVDRFWLTALHTHLLERRLGGQSELSGLADFPFDRTLLAAGVDAGPHELALQANRRGSAQASADERSQIDPFTTVDLAWRWSVTPKSRLSVQAINIADTAPERTPFVEAGNVLAQHYDIIGRRYAVELEVRF